ncbi:hypothetical protein B2J93_6843 [Marssonina coronariae]|uniref:Uncharacterized protein n=1 Tax=Diplocarpon coronariae TaxID=2795749 RepID=A0A218YVG1_9HELO|nr:hypothetical protein B2J93_6843 [Marssonina coronariae]
MRIPLPAGGAVDAAAVVVVVATAAAVVVVVVAAAAATTATTTTTTAATATAATATAHLGNRRCSRSTPSLILVASSHSWHGMAVTGGDKTRGDRGRSVQGLVPV